MGESSTRCLHFVADRGDSEACLRTAALGLGALAFGPVASPLALALAEAVQLGAWWRWQPQRAP
jgi:hypothetical protein